MYSIRCFPGLTGLFAFVGLALVAEAQQAGIQDLGNFVGLPNATRAEARAISPDGQFIVGFSDVGSTSSLRGFRWTAATGQQDLAPSVAFSSLFAVSDDGAVAAGQAKMPGVSNSWLACRWTAATGLVPLGTLGVSGVGALSMSHATAMNSDGTVIVGYDRYEGSSGAVTRAFRWTASGGMQDLGLLASFTGSSSVASDVSANGDIVVGSAHDAFGRLRAFRWTPAGGMQDLGVMSGIASDNSAAYGVSNDGNVIVGTSGSALVAPGAPNVQAPFRWTAAGGMQPLPVPGGAPGVALATNTDGSVVAGHFFTPSSVVQRHAFRWTAATSTVELESFGGSTTPTALSGDGSIVVGFGQIGGPGGGPTRAFRWSADGLETRYCAALPNSTGQTGRLEVFGNNLVANNNVQLSASNLPPQRLGYFLASTNQGNSIPFNSQGRLCLAQPLVRFAGAGQVLNSGPLGTFALQLDLTSFSAGPGLIGVAPGDTWNFQAWHRDPGPVTTTNLTDAVSVRFR
jgi:probable HAF family extracellular repeat protein